MKRLILGLTLAALMALTIAPVVAQATTIHSMASDPYDPIP